jgi:hypothetical protein
VSANVKLAVLEGNIKAYCVNASCVFKGMVKESVFNVIRGSSCPTPCIIILFAALNADLLSLS